MEVFPKLKEKYGDKIRFVYRDFPLYGNHPEAAPAAQAANCANEQNKYWEYHNLLFSSSNFGASVYETYAQNLGLDMTKFNDCISSHKYAKDIQSDSDFATNLGVNSTPTFFVNGRKIARNAKPHQRLLDFLRLCRRESDSHQLLRIRRAHGIVLVVG